MFDQNALKVLKKRYLVKDAQGVPTESPEEMFRRVAEAVAKAEENYPDDHKQDVAETFFGIMNGLEFLPNSPALMNAGRPLGQLAACFVLPIEDSLDSVFDTLRNMAMIHRTGGGTGFSFSRLRPADDFISSTMGLASGPLPFIRVFDAATEAIRQGGTRRGANMGVLRINHPDIEDFIMAKRDFEELNNFNLSVAITDVFMDAYENDLPFSLVNPRTNKEVRKVRPRDLFHLLAESAWLSGEPGVIFIDTVNRMNPTPQAGSFEATNPCGEQPLLPYESCCLGSVNLSLMTKHDNVDWDRLKETIHQAVRFLDDMIDVTAYPLPEIERMTKGNRKIGLGVMGYAHMLIRLGVSYDSPTAVYLAQEVMSFVRRESKEASLNLAKERGLFPFYKGSIWDRVGLAQRNASTTTIAPTGTLSIIAGTSGGVEPIYDITYSRTFLDGVTVVVTDPLYVELKEKLDPGEIERLFRTSREISPTYHLAIQKAFQDHTDSAVSKTINLPYEVKPEEIQDIYCQAYRMGLKGITVFRDKSRDRQVFACGNCLAVEK